MPLAVGNQWIMQMNGVRDGRTYARIDTFTVVQDTTIAGETWYEVALPHPRASLGFSGGFYTNRDDGLWGWGLFPDGSFSATLVYPFPADVGTEYPAREGATARIAATDSLYQTPSGAFQSYQYQTTYTSTLVLGEPVPLDEPIQSDTFLAPGIGLVRLSCFWARLNDDGRFERIGSDTWELLEFREAQ